VEPRNRYELEAMGCGVLFVLVILALVSWSLYEHGYLGVAVAVVGGVALSVGLIRAFRAWVAPRYRVTQGRPQGEWQMRLPWEQERRPPEYEERPVYSVPRERRKEEEQPRVPLERDALVQRLNEISDGEFEQLMAYYFRRRGYAVEPTPTTGDRGADLVIKVADRRVSVLLKRQDVPVGNRAVQEALSGRAFYGADEAWVITNNAFTKGTRYDARGKGVRLIDGNELAEWLDKLLHFLEDEP
jgi:hypothetical protein